MKITRSHDGCYYPYLSYGYEQQYISCAISSTHSTTVCKSLLTRRKNSDNNSKAGVPSVATANDDADDNSNNDEADDDRDDNYNNVHNKTTTIQTEEMTSTTGQRQGGNGHQAESWADSGGVPSETRPAAAAVHVDKYGNDHFGSGRMGAGVPRSGGGSSGGEDGDSRYNYTANSVEAVHHIPAAADVTSSTQAPAAPSSNSSVAPSVPDVAVSTSKSRTSCRFCTQRKKRCDYVEINNKKQPCT